MLSSILGYNILVGFNSIINEREVFCAFQFDSLSHKKGGLLHFLLHIHESLLLHFCISPQIPLGAHKRHKRGHQSITDMIDVLRATFISSIIPY